MAECEECGEEGGGWHSVTGNQLAVAVGSSSGSCSSNSAKASLDKKQDTVAEFQNKYRFHSTFDIISAAEKGELPDKIMLTIHPQRWHDKPLPWLKELVWQHVKNVGKRIVIGIPCPTDWVSWSGGGDQ